MNSILYLQEEHYNSSIFKFFTLFFFYNNKIVKTGYFYNDNTISILVPLQTININEFLRLINGSKTFSISIPSKKNLSAYLKSNSFYNLIESYIKNILLNS